MSWAEQASLHVIGPVRHAARYNPALRQADPADSQDQVRLRSQVDVAGFDPVMDSQHVIHASRRHGRGEQEARQGQLAIELENFSRLPRILGDPDRIEPGVSGRRSGSPDKGHQQRNLPRDRRSADPAAAGCVCHHVQNQDGMNVFRGASMLIA